MALTKVTKDVSSTPGIVDNSDGTAITIDSSENVGIGTTSPSAMLDVRGDFTVGAQPPDLMVDYANSRVGINVAPDCGFQAKVDKARFQDPSAGQWLEINPDSNPVQIIASDQTGANYCAMRLRINNGGAYPVTVMDVKGHSGAHVGFGTDAHSTAKMIISKNPDSDTQTTPQTILQLANPCLTTASDIKVGQGPQIAFEIPDDQAGNKSLGASIAAQKQIDDDNDSTTRLTFFTTQNDETLDEAMTILGDGKVGIGTSSPDVKLDIRGEVAVDYNASHGLRFYNQARNNWSSIGNRDTGTGADLQFKTGNATALNLNHGGDLTHMGTSAFATGVTSLRKRTLSSKDFAELAMAGEYSTNDTLVVYDTTNNATRFKVNYQGTVYATSTTISSLSDERLKENVRDLDKGLADILKLKPRRFDWKAEEGSGKTDVTGFIAQECETAGFEEFVGTVDFSETIKNVKTFGYGGLVPALVKAIQELSTKLEAAEARITTLEG